MLSFARPPSPPKNENVIYGQEFSEQHKFSLRPRLFLPKNFSDQNIKSELSFRAFILENFSKYLNLPWAKSQRDYIPMFLL